MANEKTKLSNVIEVTPKANTSTRRKKRCCNDGPLVWCRKYWWEGQDLRDSRSIDTLLEGQPLHKRILIKYRRPIGLFVPALFAHFIWWSYFIHHNTWHLFADKYIMSFVMIFGSLIAGMTSEGGGAVAFPVMTLVLKIHPSVARDFSAMIQSVGMSCASFAIVFMNVRIEMHSIVCCSVGGLAGTIVGLHLVDPNLSNQAKKLGFVSIWFAFASVLVILNRVVKRRTFKTIEDFNWWKLLVLIFVGFLGGVCTSFAGSGLDICSFMILTLLFRISEKIATPTSVILMALNSIFTVYWRWIMLDDVSDEAWEYLGVCAPIVVVGAPLGSLLGTHFHRLVLAGFVIVLDTVAIAVGFAVVRPLTPLLIGGCIAIIVGSFLVFVGLMYAGQRLLDKYEDRERNGELDKPGGTQQNGTELTRDPSVQERLIADETAVPDEPTEESTLQESP